RRNYIITNRLGTRCTTEALETADSIRTRSHVHTCHAHPELRRHVSHIDKAFYILFDDLYQLWLLFLANLLKRFNKLLSHKLRISWRTARYIFYAHEQLAAGLG